jgi:hypothetical protein
MPTIAMAYPIPPEKLETWRSGMREIAGPRRAEFDASPQRHGVLSCKVWLQDGPGGPLELLVIETEDPARMFTELGTSDEPFDVWFRELRDRSEQHRAVAAPALRCCSWRSSARPDRCPWADGRGGASPSSGSW